VLGPAAFAATLASPTGLEPEAHRLAAVLAWVVVYWVTEAISLFAVPVGDGKRALECRDAATIDRGTIPTSSYDVCDRTM
jgi:hypothetical protein